MSRVVNTLSVSGLILLLSSTATAEPSASRRGGGFRVELQGYGGVVVPDRTSSEFSTGPVYGGVILARPVWWFAAGALWERSSLGWHAEGRSFDDPNATLTATSTGIALRLYATDETWAEPYFHLAFTGNDLDASVSSPQCEKGGGRGAQLGFGMDAYVLFWLRAGAWFGSMLGPAGSGGCNAMWIPVEPPPVPGWPANAIVRGGVTFVFGGPGDRGLVSF